MRVRNGDTETDTVPESTEPGISITGEELKAADNDIGYAKWLKRLKTSAPPRDD